MSHQYHRSFDPAAEDSLAKLARLVPAGSQVLDVGAGPGVLAGHLTEQRACYVDGIEYDRASAEQGRRAFRSLWVADLEQTAVAELVGEARYDIIICADILEHLIAPERLLRQLAGLLAPHGRLLLSVPNLAHLGLLAELLGGELRYRQEGLLDRTHLRFFTRTSLLRLLDECGLRVIGLDRVRLPIERSEFDPAALELLPAPVAGFLRGSEEAETYQFIVDCVPRDAELPTRAPQTIPRVPDTPVDVIVPVHSGLAETRACLDSLLAAPVRTAFELVVIDDQGPEPELRAWLRELAAQGRVTLLENAENLGYVASVNRGMALHPERDVVLLNSDTEVAHDWLDRLRAAAYASADIGTVTPFANSGATICAYPLFCVDNPLPDGWDLAALDTLISDTNPGAGVDLPTSVGYCTYVRRDCLAAVGLFDVAAFGRGYGEENDFSMRARYRGWRHRLAADVFVLHHGGVSFGPDKAALVEQAGQAVRERHPAYDLLVAEHIRQDPARHLRERVDWRRLARSPRRRLLFITHALGGGVERHVGELAEWLAGEAEVLVLRPTGEDGIALSWQRRGETATLTFQRAQDLGRLIDLLRALDVERAHVHHLLGLEEVARRVLDALAIPYDLTLHDFFPLCPRINLIDDQGRFCDQPAESECLRCLASDPRAAARDIGAWRQVQGKWLADAERVLAPSRDTAERLRRAWPDLQVRVALHDQLPRACAYPPVQPRPWHADNPLRVVVLGQLSPAKGLEVLAACARDAARRRLPLEFHLLGHPLGPVPSLAEAPLVVHGAYAESELAARLRFLSPHLAWFPAVWPETWSYTLSACLMAGLPVAAPRLGAFPERLADRPTSCLLPLGLGAEAIADHLLAFAAELQTVADTAAITDPGAPACTAGDFVYATDYLRTAPRNRVSDTTDDGELADAFVIAPSLGTRPFTLTQCTGQPLIDRLVRLREENLALRGGIHERDSLIATQLDDATRTASQLEQRALQIRSLEQELEQRRSLDHELRQRDNHIRLLDQQLDTLFHSFSWRLTRPVRGARQAIQTTRQRLAAASQTLWHRIPLPAQARYRIKSAVFRSAAPLLRGTRVYNAWLEQSRGVQQATTTPTLAQYLNKKPAIENLRLPGGVSPRPLVSVVIPVYNNLHHTLACLDSIARRMPAVPIEVLVVDDGSSDATESELSARDDIRYLRNPENLGFVGSCNRGAAAARGDYLFFLNNDTVVLEGWLDTLVQTFASVPDAGLVGSKLIYPDGRLQEAGGIIWADASGWNWGRLADPSAPEFNFLRDADYCSGAAILVPRALFAELGGFDQRYAPAYYEDTDLAFAVRSRGLRVLYQPLSQVIHYEGVTAGTDLNSGMKAYQVRNRERFREKWAPVLASHGDAESRPPRLSADRRPRARMLIIDACTPTPDQDSGSLDMLNYMRLLIGFGYRLTFVPASDLLHFGHYTSALQALGVECLYHPHITSVAEVLEARGPEFDAVMLVRVTVAHELIDKVRACCPRARVIFDTVDLHFLREQRQAELQTGRAWSPRSEEVRVQELGVIARADVTIVISPVEQELLAREAPGAPVRVIPILREIPGRSTGFDERSGLVFVGGFRHPPNIDAMVWFCGEIWPAIRRELPEVELSIIGSHLVPAVKALEGNGVRVLGFVEDLDPIFARARISVAPLRYGAGQKGKVVTSLGYGVPCVLTPVASEGLGLADEEGALIAASPADFAQAVVRLYQDPALWQRLSDGGLSRVEREFSLDTNRQRLGSLLTELGLPADSAQPADRPGTPIDHP